MKKRVYGRKLSRGFNARKALFRALIRAITLHGSIETTKAKAKSIQADIDKLVTLAKAGGINERRRVYAHLGNDRDTTDRLFGIVKTFFSSRKSGFTRIINLPRRRGDRAEVVRLEWTDKVQADDRKKVKKKASKVKDSSNKDKKSAAQSALKKLRTLRAKTKN